MPRRDCAHGPGSRARGWRCSSAPERRPHGRWICPPGAVSSAAATSSPRAQAQAILDLRLHRLTALEQGKIRQEYEELLETIDSLLQILASEEKLLSVIRAELLEIRDQFADARRTEITDAAINISREDLIAPQEMVVTLSRQGYVKVQPLSEYQVQRAWRSRPHRGGDQNRRLRLQPVGRALARHAALLLHPRTRLLAARVRTAYRELWVAWAPLCEPASAGTGRAHLRGGTHQGF